MILTIIALTVIGVGIGMLLLMWWMRRKVGLPVGNVIYSDSQREPGEVLKSKSIPLVGKPDYIMRKDGFVIPFELKRGKTPVQPYPSHLAQLYAYCMLVEENYGIRPPYGIIDYPDQDFRLEYGPGTEDHLKLTIKEMLEKKKGNLSRKGLRNICRNCRLEHTS